ncbi:MAG: MFS transporter [Clostridia bacterium]|nr:MFS transporter [Clostridia bacterium]MBR5772191.1 MFS transporter [Clostridia bacterium]
MEEKKYIGNKEKWMFALGAGGQGMIYAMMSSYISDYYVSVLKLPLMFILLLMFLARIWDAINDPLMGMIVDHKTTKWGKMKPYILFASVPIAILTLLMYCSPNLPTNQLMIFSAVVYVMWGMIYTMADVPFWGLPNVMTPDTKERGSLISFTKIINSIGSALPEVFFIVAGLVLPMILDKSNVEVYNKQKYLIVAVAVVVIGSIFYINSYFHIKERVVPPIKKRKPGEPTQLKRLFTCKPMVLVLITGVLSSGRYMFGAATLHVARYAFYIGPDFTGMTPEEKLAAVEASVSAIKMIFNICSIVGMFGAMLVMPFLMKKFDYKKIMITTCLAGAAAAIPTTLVGWFTGNLYACIPFIIISCIPIGVINVLVFAMICDCLDYMELTTGFRDNGLGSACSGFINKLGNAIATSGIIVLFLVIGFNPAEMLSPEVAQAATEFTREQNFAVFSLVSIFPGVSLLLCAIPMFFYKISGKQKEEMIEQLKAKREAEGVTVNE